MGFNLTGFRDACLTPHGKMFTVVFEQSVLRLTQPTERTGQYKVGRIRRFVRPHKHLLTLREAAGSAK